MTVIREEKLTPHQARELEQLGFILVLKAMGRTYDTYFVGVQS